MVPLADRGVTLRKAELLPPPEEDGGEQSWVVGKILLLMALVVPPRGDPAADLILELK